MPLEVTLTTAATRTWVGAEARANKIKCGDVAIFHRADEMLFDDLPRVAGPLHAKPVEDVQSISDLVAAGADELERV